MLHQLWSRGREVLSWSLAVPISLNVRMEQSSRRDGDGDAEDLSQNVKSHLGYREERLGNSQIPLAFSYSNSVQESTDEFSN